MKWKSITPRVDSNPWELGVLCDAVYQCPKDPETGKRLGPLVPYAGKDARGRNLVGDDYFNFAKIEEQPQVLDFFATKIARLIAFSDVLCRATTIVGIPDGGRSLGQAVARFANRRFVYPVKVPRPKLPGATKDEFNFVFTRIELSEDDFVIVCDDVHNNFQNTGIVLDEIKATGAKVIGLCSALNCSMTFDHHYLQANSGPGAVSIPIATAIRRAIPEFDQDDPAVIDDIRSGNLEPHVKANWERLKSRVERRG